MDRRFCTHSHRGSSRAWRLVLARHVLNGELHQQIIDEHGDCADCLRDTLEAAVNAAATMLLRCWPVPGMDAGGLVSGDSVTWLLDIIDSSLRAEQLDRRDIGG
jgi:hypothetical protein